RSDRTIAGMTTALQCGKWVHKAPVGYVNSKEPGGLSHDPKTARLVQLAFEVYAEGKLSKAQVLKYVTELGLRNAASGNPLTPQTFDRMLRNPLYAGHVTSAWGIQRRGAFQAIVSDEVFSQVEARLIGTKPVRQTRTRENEMFPLRVFIRCSSCEKGITGS